MRNRHHVAQIIVVVAQNIRMELRRWRSAKGAAALALADLRIDPSLDEELRGDLAKGRSEKVEGTENDPPRLIEGEWVDFFAYRRVLIVQSQSRELQQLGFQSEIFV